MPDNTLKSVKADTEAFVTHSGCGDEIKSITQKIISFAGKPKEDEVLVRCCMVFESILRGAILQAKDVDASDLSRFSVEIEKE